MANGLKTFTSAIQDKTKKRELLSVIGCTEGQALFAYYYDCCPETYNNASASYLKAFPNQKPENASHATSMLKSPGVIKARDYFRSLRSREALINSEHNDRVITETQLLEELSDMCWNKPNEEGIYRYPMNVKLGACKEMADIFGLKTKTATNENKIEAISINYNNYLPEKALENEIIDTVFSENDDKQD